MKILKAIINHEEMEELFSNISGNDFVYIKTETKPSLTGGKKNVMQGKITKSNEANVVVFQNKKSNGYENKVKSRLIAEGKNPDAFTLGERAWGTRKPNTPIIEHKGKKYLEVIFLSTYSTEYYIEKANCIEEIEKDKIIGLKPSSTDNGQGGLEDAVIIRTLSFDSVKSFKLNKTEYIVEN